MATINSTSYTLQFCLLLFCLLSDFSSQVSWTPNGLKELKKTLQSQQLPHPQQTPLTSTSKQGFLYGGFIRTHHCGTLSVEAPNSLLKGALVSWTVDGSEVKDRVLTSAEELKNGRYSRSSTLTLSKDLWEKGEHFICTVYHDNVYHSVTFSKCQCKD
ncbi:immunoglobulin lambda-1 light chain-like isoform X2 [Silurus asotus]|nr:immunoglobulin lambda-1 light chain-like isoform X2 [Silurus asotus]